MFHILCVGRELVGFVMTRGRSHGGIIFKPSASLRKQTSSSEVELVTK